MMEMAKYHIFLSQHNDTMSSFKKNTSIWTEVGMKELHTNKDK